VSAAETLSASDAAVQAALGRETPAVALVMRRKVRLAGGIALALLRVFDRLRRVIVRTMRSSDRRRGLPLRPSCLLACLPARRRPAILDQRPRWSPV